MEKTVNKGGRPSHYNQELAEKICKAIASSNTGIKKLCNSRPDFPNCDTIFEWIRSKPGFSEMYAAARRHQAEVYAEGIITIADDDSIDPFRARIMIDARKWIACKLIPRLYGDKIQADIGVDDKLLVDVLRKEIDKCKTDLKI